MFDNRVYLNVSMRKDLEEFILNYVQDNDKVSCELYESIKYFFWCHSFNHRIHDFPLLAKPYPYVSSTNPLDQGEDQINSQGNNKTLWVQVLERTRK